MTFRVLAVWFFLLVAIGALAQPAYYEEVRSVHKGMSYPLDLAFQRLIRDPENREYKIRRHGEVIFMNHQEDTTRPYYFYYKCKYSTPDGDSAKVNVYINPEDKQICFDVTNGFEELTVEGTKHAIRGNQRFRQTTLKNSYEGPFTAMFLGAFTMPYPESYPQRAGGCWGPTEFVTAATYTAYDVSRSYLDVQSICIVIEADPKLADLIMSKIKFGILNEAIETL